MLKTMMKKKTNHCCLVSNSSFFSRLDVLKSLFNKFIKLLKDKLYKIGFSGYTPDSVQHTPKVIIPQPEITNLFEPKYSAREFN